MTIPDENTPPTLEGIAAEQQHIVTALNALVEAVNSLISGQNSLISGQNSQSAAIEALSNGETALASAVQALTPGMVDIRNDLAGTNAKVDSLRDDIGLVKGGHARNAMRQNLERISDSFGFKFIAEVPQAAVIEFAKVAEAGGEAANDAESFRNADMVMNVRDGEGHPGYVTLEASFTVNSNDVRRAVRNARYLHEYTGLPCYAAVAGVQVLPEAQAEIDAVQALFYQIPARELQSE